MAPPNDSPQRGNERVDALPVVRDAIVPDAAPPDIPKLFYRRSSRFPRAIAWFGFRSFWGHLWHLIASVLATEDIDSRDWMHADAPEELTRHIARVLGIAVPSGARITLTEALDRDVWIDFLADTGDCSEVSRVVAKMLFAEYEVEDPDDPEKRLRLPRGDVLIFGGDTAYPVATDIEIHNRVIVPFNKALRTRDDGKPRALLGIPGNHDWYAGLDGFGRMFRRRSGKLDRAAQNKVETDDHVDRLGQIGHFIDWIEAFRVGKLVVKRAALALAGYEPVQSASYWALRLAPALDVWGLDRQLRLVDFRQRGYFADLRDLDRGIVLCLADPVWAFLEPSPAGVHAIEAVGLDIEKDKLLILTGDTHHYCRQSFGDGMHVVAGGGGAFLHAACIARRGLKAPDAEFPGPKVSLALALQIPWQIVHGRSGFMVHAVIAAAYAPTFLAQWKTGGPGLTACAITAVIATLAGIGLGGWRHKAFRIAGLSLLAGLAIGLLPLWVHQIFGWLVSLAGWKLTAMQAALAAYGLSIYVGTLLVGTFLMLLTILGLEQHQGIAALAHPGYRHFVRLRVARDGSKIEGWVLGRVDPLSTKDKVVLVDKFEWNNPKAGRGSRLPDAE